MIRNEAEYEEALRRLEQNRSIAAQQQSALRSVGLALDEVQRAMEPLLSFQAQLAEEIDWYEGVRRREFPVIRRLPLAGRLLIALRIASGITQRSLAARLEVSEAVVSRDEHNEYHGITLDRAQRILDALRASVTLRVEDYEGTAGEAGDPAKQI